MSEPVKINTLKVTKKVTTETDEERIEYSLERGDIKIIVKTPNEMDLDYGDEINLVFEKPQQTLT